MTVTVGLAFLAGIASFLSPCVFSLVPAYVGYLSGRSVAGSPTTETTIKARWSTFSHGLAFVIGFSTIFILLGLAVSALSSVFGIFYDISPVISKIGGFVVILFGLHMTGILRIPFLEYDLRPQSRLDQNRSYLSSFLMGVFFSAGWSPCVGPVLGSILTMALSLESVGTGVELLVFYSAGLAVPFLLAALGIGWVSEGLKKYRKAMHYVEVVMGGVLVVVGVLLILGTFQTLARFGTFIDLGL